MQRFNQYIGLAGVAYNETNSAKLWGKYFSILLIGAVLWLAFQWHLELKNDLSVDDAWFANFIVWSFFVTETAVLTLLVKNKKNYLLGNWLNLFIILAGVPLLLWDFGPVVTILRILRILLIIGLLTPWLAICFRFLTDNRLDTTIIAAMIILVLAGTLMASIDPGIQTVEDGIWWAWVTISTVGYGDIVPQTTAGRLFAGVLIFIGMGLFAVITANFTALFVRRNAKNNQYMQLKWEKSFSEFEKSKDREKSILRELKAIRKRLDKFEEKNSSP